jgi:hypothetical protein
LSAGIGEDLVERLAHAQDFAGVDVNIGGLPGQTVHRRLVDEDAGVGEAEALSLGAAGKQHGGHGGSLADAVGGDIGLDEIHRVEDRQAGGDGATGGVDVEGDVPFGIFSGQEEHLGDDEVGDLVVDGGPEKDDVFFEQARVDIVGTFTARGLLDHHGDQNRIFHLGHASLIIAPYSLE